MKKLILVLLAVMLLTACGQDAENNQEAVYVNITAEEAKQIIKTADSVLGGKGLVRVFCQPTPNLEDATVFRMTARYRAIVDENLNFYRR